MAWQYDEYTWQSGWFLDQYRQGNGDSTLLFSADGVSQTANGLPGDTVASNLPELRNKRGSTWDSLSRPGREGDSLTFELNESNTRIIGLPDHPVLRKPALTQVLDDAIEGVEWETSLFDDIVNIEINSPYAPMQRLNVQSYAGDDIFNVKGILDPLTGCSQFAGAYLDGGVGYDRLILEGVFDQYNISVSPDRSGFDINEWGSSSCSYLMARDIEIIQGSDFTWTFGDRFPVMGAPSARNPEIGGGQTSSPSALGQNISEDATTIVNNYITNNTSSVVNNTNNFTTTNISNAGNGNISIGDIGSVNNSTVIDNSFSIQVTNVNLSVAITGESKKSEKVEGTEGDDLIADGRGRDKLIGGDGSDQFYFSGEEPFKKKTVDKVVDFDAAEGDVVVIADEVIDSLDEDPEMAVADTKKELKQLSKEGYDLVYFEDKGHLYVDGNGDSKGFGKKTEGGMIADLPNDTVLTEDDVLIGV